MKHQYGRNKMLSQATWMVIFAGEDVLTLLHLYQQRVPNILVYLNNMVQTCQSYRSFW